MNKETNFNYKTFNLFYLTSILSLIYLIFSFLLYHTHTDDIDYKFILIGSLLSFSLAFILKMIVLIKSRQLSKHFKIGIVITISSAAIMILKCIGIFYSLNHCSWLNNYEFYMTHENIYLFIYIFKITNITIEFLFLLCICRGLLDIFDHVEHPDLEKIISGNRILLIYVIIFTFFNFFGLSVFMAPIMYFSFISMISNVQKELQ